MYWDEAEMRHGQQETQMNASRDGRKGGEGVRAITRDAVGGREQKFTLFVFPLLWLCGILADTERIYGGEVYGVRGHVSSIVSKIKE